MITIQPSHNNENRNERASSPFKEYREKSRASGTQNKTREQDAGKENKSSWFSSPLTTSPLTRTFACHSKWIGCSRSITFPVNRARSLFAIGEPVFVGNSDEKIRAIYILSNVHYDSTFPFSLILTNTEQFPRT